MKYIKLFESSDIDDALLDILDVFRNKIADEYFLTKVDDPCGDEAYRQGWNTYSIKKENGHSYVGHGKLPLLDRDKFGYDIVICIIFDDYFGSAGNEGGGDLGEDFQMDVHEFIRQIKSYGCDGVIDWEGGPRYQILIKVL